MSERPTQPSDYVTNYLAFVDTLPTGIAQAYPSPSEQDLIELSRYSSAGYRTKDSAPSPEAPRPFPPGHIRPMRLDAASYLLGHLRPNSSEAFKYNARGYKEDPIEYRRATEPWQRFYAQYIRQWHTYHAAFLTAIHDNNAPAPVETFRNLAATPATPPASYSTRPLTPAELQTLYNHAQWATYSVLNVLFAPPQEISSQAQQQALRLFAQEVEPESLEGINELYDIGQQDKAATVGNRLPPSFVQTHHEIDNALHPQWRSNATIISIFGNTHDIHRQPFAAACNHMLLEYPAEIVHVLLLHLADRSVISEKQAALQALHALGRQPQEVLDRIVHNEAAHRIVHREPRTPYELTARQMGLDSLLHETSDLEVLQAMTAASIARIRNLGAQILGLQAKIRGLEATVAARESLLTAQNTELATARLRHEHYDLFARHGVNMDAPSEILLTVVAAVRRSYAKQFHPTLGTSPDEERLKQLNNELDTILRLRGLKPSDDVPHAPTE